MYQSTNDNKKNDLLEFLIIPNSCPKLFPEPWGLTWNIWFIRCSGKQNLNDPKVRLCDGQGGLACCNSWGRKELDTTERLNWTEGETGSLQNGEVSDEPSSYSAAFIQPHKNWLISQVFLWSLRHPKALLQVLLYAGKCTRHGSCPQGVRDVLDAENKRVYSEL